MDATRKYPEWGDPVTKEHTWYVLTEKWILAQKFRIPKIQFTDPMKLKKKEDQSMRASVLSLTPPLGTLCSVQWLAASIGHCTCQALAKPLRRAISGSCLGLVTVYGMNTKGISCTVRSNRFALLGLGLTLGTLIPHCFSLLQQLCYDHCWIVEA